MKKLLILLFSVCIYAVECVSLEECLKNANYYQFDKNDETNAALYYKVSCEEYEDYLSCKALSDIYKYSDKLENKKLNKKYKNLAIKLVKQSCKDDDNANACYDFANFCEVKYTQCDDFEKLYERAFNLYEKQCNNNDYSSCYFLANMYLNGVSTDIDEEKALELYKYACNNNDNKSCYEVSQLYENKSLEYLRKSCELEFKYACEKLDNIK
ncbi:tetratricopeptide repeat protein [Campylobacter sp. RM12647]|uniref:tetratricopeptide repeat protein n=1 Tax=Campylobacter sp. RM12647 TaxID=2735737 RepID=UPI001DB48DC4|nr:sel1 repeat family protein [Campylobacter sp. RM12647]